ncbi:MAG TPA: hypothetical protein VEZ15_01675, partial [Acidimicrobiia bacterium]|nr:hypothetical protein [Acidimicrobiia bacterium]
MFLRGVEWARQQLAIVAGVTTVAMLVAAAPAHADVAAPSGQTASVGSMTVVVTPATRPDPYNGSTVGDPSATAQNAAARTFVTQAVRSRVGVVGRVADDLPAVSGVVATVTPDQLAVLNDVPDPTKFEVPITADGFCVSMVEPGARRLTTERPEVTRS